MARVMMIDDEPTIQRLMLIVLEDMGHEVISQNLNGDDALKAYKGSEDPPDLMIIDHRIPLLSGKELAAEVLEINPDQRILFLTADGSIKDEVMEMGVKDFLIKPAGIEDIKKAIGSAISS